MKSLISINSGKFEVDLTKPMDISLSLGKDFAGAWYLGKPEINPVKHGNWIGKVSEGASINFNLIEFSPHAHGTHTESYGHISEEFYSVNQVFTQYFFKAKLISLSAEKKNGDQILSLKNIAKFLQKNEADALIIRSLPNSEEKKSKNYDHSNWPYLEEKAAAYIRTCGVDHLLIDLPSVDREEGEVKAHRAFWNYPEKPRKNASITEMIYVPDEIADGFYLLHLQVANFHNDAAPSRPVLYEIIEIENGK